MFSNILNKTDSYDQNGCLTGEYWEWLDAGSRRTLYYYLDSCVLSKKIEQSWDIQHQDWWTEKKDSIVHATTRKTYHYSSRNYERNLATTYEQDYYCDDELRDHRTIYNGRLSFRRSFSYLEPIPREEKEVENLSIFPNPTSRYLNIQSDLLEFGDSDFIITNSLGRVLINIPINHKAELLELDIQK